MSLESIEKPTLLKISCIDEEIPSHVPVQTSDYQDIYFDSPSEFNAWYLQHGDCLKNISTILLNKFVHIEGYRLIRRGKPKVLTLLSQAKKYGRNAMRDEINEVKAQLEEHNVDIINLTATLNQLIRMITKQ
jgi:hypothetical protein